jgi:hypothetical protein
LGEAEEEAPAEDADLAPEFALARDGNGNGWKQA